MKIETNLDYNSILAGEAEVVHLAVSLKAEPQEGGRAKPSMKPLLTVIATTRTP